MGDKEPALMIGLVKIAALILLCFSTSIVVSPQNTHRSVMPEDVTVFIAGKSGQFLTVYPAVIIHYGGNKLFATAYGQPLPENYTAADLNKLKQFLKPGNPITVFSGGKQLGTARVISNNAGQDVEDCPDVSGYAAYEGEGQPLLGANTSLIAGHASTRRAASPAEIAILKRVSEKWLVDYGLDNQLVQRGTMGQVVSTELRSGAGRALIGRLDVTSKSAVFRLFVIAERENGRYRATLADLQVQHDLEDEGDKVESSYLDQLDIDNDGLDDVITTATFYEATGATVWKYDAGKGVWAKRYEAMLGSC